MLPSGVTGASLESRGWDVNVTDQVLPGPRTGTPRNVLGDETERIGFRRPGRPDDVTGVNENVFRDGYFPHDFLKRQNLLAGERGFQVGNVTAGRLFENS